MALPFAKSEIGISPNDNLLNHINSPIPCNFWTTWFRARSNPFNWTMQHQIVISTTSAIPVLILFATTYKLN